MKTVYLTPSDALQFANNTWLYHQCPSQVQWLKDIETQKEMHVAQGSNHLSFTFLRTINLMNSGLNCLKN